MVPQLKRPTGVVQRGFESPPERFPVSLTSPSMKADGKKSRKPPEPVLPQMGNTDFETTMRVFSELQQKLATKKGVRLDMAATWEQASTVTVSPRPPKKAEGGRPRMRREDTRLGVALSPHHVLRKQAAAPRSVQQNTLQCQTDTEWDSAVALTSEAGIDHQAFLRSIMLCPRLWDDRGDDLEDEFVGIAVADDVEMAHEVVTMDSSRSSSPDPAEEVLSDMKRDEDQDPAKDPSEAERVVRGSADGTQSEPDETKETEGAGETTETAGVPPNKKRKESDFLNSKLPPSTRFRNRALTRAKCSYGRMETLFTEIEAKALEVQRGFAAFETRDFDEVCSHSGKETADEEEEEAEDDALHEVHPPLMQNLVPKKSVLRSPRAATGATVGWVATGDGGSDSPACRAEAGQTRRESEGETSSRRSSASLFCNASPYPHISSFQRQSQAMSSASTPMGEAIPTKDEVAAGNKETRKVLHLGKVEAGFANLGQHELQRAAASVVVAGANQKAAEDTQRKLKKKDDGGKPMDTTLLACVAELGPAALPFQATSPPTAPLPDASTEDIGRRHSFHSVTRDEHQVRPPPIYIPEEPETPALGDQPPPHVPCKAERDREDLEHPPAITTSAANPGRAGEEGKKSVVKFHANPPRSPRTPRVKGKAVQKKNTDAGQPTQFNTPRSRFRASMEQLGERTTHRPRPPVGRGSADGDVLSDLASLGSPLRKQSFCKNCCNLEVAKNNLEATLLKVLPAKRALEKEFSVLTQQYETKRSELLHMKGLLTTANAKLKAVLSSKKEMEAAHMKTVEEMTSSIGELEVQVKERSEERDGVLHDLAQRSADKASNKQKEANIKSQVAAREKVEKQLRMQIGTQHRKIARCRKIIRQMYGMMEQQRMAEYDIAPPPKHKEEGSSASPEPVPSSNNPLILMVSRQPVIPKHEIPPGEVVRQPWEYSKWLTALSKGLTLHCTGTQAKVEEILKKLGMCLNTSGRYEQIRAACFQQIQVVASTLHEALLDTLTFMASHIDAFKDSKEERPVSTRATASQTVYDPGMAVAMAYHKRIDDTVTKCLSLVPPYITKPEPAVAPAFTLPLTPAQVATLRFTDVSLLEVCEDIIQAMKDYCTLKRKEDIASKLKKPMYKPPTMSRSNMEQWEQDRAKKREARIEELKRIQQSKWASNVEAAAENTTNPSSAREVEGSNKRVMAFLQYLRQRKLKRIGDTAKAVAPSAPSAAVTTPKSPARLTARAMFTDLLGRLAVNAAPQSRSPSPVPNLIISPRGLAPEPPPT
eukprot:Sspe_Gene.32201::Locus_15805_Transcript_1_1_Confidence_1.000_Length_3894::g.32201::m.32201